MLRKIFNIIKNGPKCLSGVLSTGGLKYQNTEEENNQYYKKWTQMFKWRSVFWWFKMIKYSRGKFQYYKEMDTNV